MLPPKCGLHVGLMGWSWELDGCSWDSAAAVIMIVVAVIVAAAEAVALSFQQHQHVKHQQQQQPLLDMPGNVAARLVDPPPPPPPTKTFGLNSVEPGASLGRIWVPLIKSEGNCGGRGVWGLAQDLRTFD